jgi:hypothetical protein
MIRIRAIRGLLSINCPTYVSVQARKLAGDLSLASSFVVLSELDHSWGWSAMFQGSRLLMSLLYFVLSQIQLNYRVRVAQEFCVFLIMDSI